MPDKESEMFVLARDKRGRNASEESYLQFPERARAHQLRGISMVSHFLNVEQMCRDVRRAAREGERDRERKSDRATEKA